MLGSTGSPQKKANDSEWGAPYFPQSKPKNNGYIF